MPMANRKMAIPKSAPVERLLLFVTLAVIPMQANLPKLRGFGFAFMLFGVVLAHQLFFRPLVFWRSARHRIFIAGYYFIGFIGIMDLIHGNPDIYGIMRILFMLVGGIVVASICRDRRAFYVGLIGYVVGSLVFSSILLMESYGKVSSINTASNDFYDVSHARADVFSQSSLEENLNTIAFYSSQGAISALVFSLLGGGGGLRRILLAGAGFICVIAAFVTMSRTGIITLLIAAAAIAYSYGLARTRIIISAVLLGIVVLIAVPSSVFSRLTFSTEKAHGEFEDSRAQVYAAVLTHFPEYFITGVGMGNFYGAWGRGSEFGNRYGIVAGTHNCFCQVTICWGVGGLVTFLFIIWNVYRSFPRRGDDRDALLLCLLGVSVSAAVFLMFTHEIELKPFSAVLGLLAASDLWIWRAGARQRVAERNAPAFWQRTKAKQHSGIGTEAH